MPSSLTSILVNDWSVCLEYSSLICLAPVPSSCLRDLRDHVLWEVFSETVPGLSKVSSSSAPLWTFPSRSRLHRFVFVCVSLTGCESPVSLAQGPVDSRCSREMCCLSECGVLPLGSIRASTRLVPMSFIQILFACAEALHAHGYSSEASRLTVELAQDLLANPPDLKVEPPPAKVRPLTLPSASPPTLPHTPRWESPSSSTKVSQTHLPASLCFPH